MISNREIFLADCQPISEEQYYQQFNPQTEMKMKLTRPLAFIDIESTGAKPDKDKIVEISVCKLYPDLSRDTMTRRVNPGIAIPQSAIDIHGITWEDVKDCPKFEGISTDLKAFIDGCDVAGFNSNKFDIPMLYLEFARVGVHWDYEKFSMVDVRNIFTRKEERTLAAAYKRYCGKELTGAHGAEADIHATVDIFLAQVDEYSDLPDNIEAMALYSNYDRPILDVSGKFYLNSDGYICFSFGKHMDQRADQHLDYVEWMLYKADYPNDTRRICAKLLGKNAPAPMGKGAII